MEDCAEEVMKLTYENYSRKQILQWISGIVPGNTQDNILEQGRLGSDYAKAGWWLARYPLYLQWIASQGWCIEKQGFFQDGRNRTWNIPQVYYLPQAHLDRQNAPTIWLRGSRMWKNGFDMSRYRMANSQGRSTF
jgi:hypothetical protein